MEAEKPLPLLPKGALVGGTVQPPPSFVEYWYDNNHLHLRQVVNDLWYWEQAYKEQEAANEVVE